MTVAIHQANFCPRLSFFQKMAESDIFVLMSHCQFSSSAYQHRFNIGDTNYNMVVERGKDLIVNKKYKNPHRDWKAITKVFPSLKRFDHYITSNLYITNHAIILSACEKLGIKTHIVRDYETDLTGSERLLDLCKTHRATKYLSGISGKKYLDIELFNKNGIEVIFQEPKKQDSRPLAEFI